MNFAEMRSRVLLSVFSLAGVIFVSLKLAIPNTPAADGTGTIVTPEGNRYPMHVAHVAQMGSPAVYDIHGGTRSRSDANLFHRFDQFGLDSGQIANFLTNPQTRNILGRLVGGRKRGKKMNPAGIVWEHPNFAKMLRSGSILLPCVKEAGKMPALQIYKNGMHPIVFGPNPRLNVPAALTATTANGIGFNCWFNASALNDYKALVGTPSALAFPAVASLWYVGEEETLGLMTAPGVLSL